MSNVDPSAEVHESVTIPTSTRVWGHTQIRENAKIGANCIIGRNVYIGPGVVIGDNCKIQNNALIYEPAVLEEGVFIGPAAVLTNDRRPRAINRDGSLKEASDWELAGVLIRKGASVGANAVCVAPVEVGEWSVIAANSVIIRDALSETVYAGSPGMPKGPAYK
jgi:UDP-2-acetamido-3-amino-2,3-dideoxy-glucuronate N-acetyltransferase